MACNSASFSLSPCKDFSTKFFKKSKPALVICSITNRSPNFNTLLSEAVKHLVPAARFEASKLKVVLMEDETNKSSEIIPRTYILSHCDFTAELTLTMSNVINLDQLRGWYSKDDVVAEWKKLDGQLSLHIHCYVCGPNLLLDLAAELRYHIFSKEMPLVLEAVIHGDSELFEEHPELMDAIVWIYFHSSSPKYNRIECWGSLKQAAKGRQEDQLEAYSTLAKNGSATSRRWQGPKSIFQALFAFLL